MSTNPKRRSVLHLVPKPHDAIDADWIASTVMEHIDKEDPGFWAHHPVAARGKVRNTIVLAILAEGAKLCPPTPSNTGRA